MKALKYALAVTTLLLFVVACATPPEDDPVEVAPEELERLRTQAQELQALIAEYGLDEYEEEEFALGVAAFERGESLRTEDPDGALEDYEQSIGHFDVVVERGFGALLVDRQSEVEGARQAAIDARAPTAVAAEFEDAEDVLAQAIELRETGAYEESYASFADAEERFDSSRQTAERLHEDALARQDEAETAKQAAIDARAPRAAASEFEAAEEVFVQGKELLEDAVYEDSIASFDDAEERFNTSRQTAERKRDDARAALDQLDERFSEAETQASEVERELEEEERALEEAVEDEEEREEL